MHNPEGLVVVVCLLVTIAQGLPAVTVEQDGVPTLLEEHTNADSPHIHDPSPLRSASLPDQSVTELPPAAPGTFVWTVQSNLPTLPQPSRLSGLAVVNDSLAVISDAANNVVFFLTMVPTQVSLLTTVSVMFGIPPTAQSGLFAGGLVDGTPSMVEFSDIVGLCTNGQTVFVLDQGGQAVRLISVATLNTTTLFFTTSISSLPPLAPPGPVGKAGIGQLTSCATSGSNILFLTDGVFNCVYEVDLGANTITTIAGYFASPGTEGLGYVDGLASSALFASPKSLAYDPTYNVMFIVDTGNSVIRVLSNPGMGSTSQVSTVIGNSSATFSVNPSSPLADGAPLAAFVMSHPMGVALRGPTNGTSGMAVVADSYANALFGANMTADWAEVVGGTPSVSGGFVDGSFGIAQLHAPICIAYVGGWLDGFLFISQSLKDVRYLNTQYLSVMAPPVVTSLSPEGSDGGGGGGGINRTVFLAVVISVSSVAALAIVALVIVLRRNEDLRKRLLHVIIQRQHSKQRRKEEGGLVVRLEETKSKFDDSASSASASALSSNPTLRTPARPVSTRSVKFVQVVKEEGEGSYVASMPRDNSVPDGVAASYVGEMPVFARTRSDRTDDTGYSRTSVGSMESGGGALTRERSLLSLEDSTYSHTSLHSANSGSGFSI